MRVIKLWDPPPDSVRDWAPLKPRLVAGMEDGSDLLAAGVYVLWFQGKMVHTDWAPNVLERVAIHRQLWGRQVPSCMPMRGFRFDAFTWKKCPEFKSESTLREIKEALRGEPALP